MIFFLHFNLTRSITVIGNLFYSSDDLSIWRLYISLKELLFYYMYIPIKQVYDKNTFRVHVFFFIILIWFSHRCICPQVSLAIFIFCYMEIPTKQSNHQPGLLLNVL